MRRGDLRRCALIASRGFPTSEHARRHEGEEKPCHERCDRPFRAVHRDAGKACGRECDREKHRAAAEAAATGRHREPQPGDRARRDHRRPHIGQPEPARHLPLHETPLVEPRGLASLRPAERREDLRSIRLEVCDRRGMVEEPLLRAAGQPGERAPEKPGEEDRAMPRERPQMCRRHEADPRRRERRASPRLDEIVMGVPREHRHGQEREQQRDRVEAAAASHDAEQHERTRDEEQRVEAETRRGAEPLEHAR
jgi:hypothetical protein